MSFFDEVRFEQNNFPCPDEIGQRIPMRRAVIRRIKSSKAETFTYTQIGWIVLPTALRKYTVAHFGTRMKGRDRRIGCGPDGNGYLSSFSHIHEQRQLNVRNGAPSCLLFCNIRD